MKNIFDFTKQTITADITVYAKWEKQQYTVAFDTDGGTAITSVEVEQGAKVSSPTNPIKTDYVFKGWYKDKSFSTLFDFDKTAITSSITIYVKWLPYIQITENYLGIHSVHFDIKVNDITTKEVFGFIIAPAAATVPAAMDVIHKDGYITRTFSPTQTTRPVFLFTHIATDMAKTFAGDEFKDSASKDDVLSPGTDYTLYIYKQNKVVYTYNFTTATFAMVSARTPLTKIILNGGLLSSASSSTPAPLVIEYKASEFVFYPYNFPLQSDRPNPPSNSDQLNPATTKYRAISTDMILCATSSLICAPNFPYATAFSEIVSSRVTFTGALQSPNAPKIINQALQGTIGYYYNIKLITE